MRKKQMILSVRGASRSDRTVAVVFSASWKPEFRAEYAHFTWPAVMKETRWGR
jgi:hypothetical protein